jgi:hypothetical protein
MSTATLTSHSGLAHYCGELDREPRHVPSPEICRELAMDEFLADTEKFADWVACANPNREPSAYFGPISTEELLRLLLNVRKVNAEQMVAAWKEVQQRYVLCYATEIARRILAIQGEE